MHRRRKRRLMIAQESLDVNAENVPGRQAVIWRRRLAQHGQGNCLFAILAWCQQFLGQVTDRDTVRDGIGNGCASACERTEDESRHQPCRRGQLVCSGQLKQIVRGLMHGFSHRVSRCRGLVQGRSRAPCCYGLRLAVSLPLKIIGSGVVSLFGAPPLMIIGSGIVAGSAGGVLGRCDWESGGTGAPCVLGHFGCGAGGRVAGKPLGCEGWSRADAGGGAVLSAGAFGRWGSGGGSIVGTGRRDVSTGCGAVSTGVGRSMSASLISIIGRAGNEWACSGAGGVRVKTGLGPRSAEGPVIQ